jgi:hypothetical protein
MKRIALDCAVAVEIIESRGIVQVTSREDGFGRSGHVI